MTELIKMVRAAGQFPPPHACDVHPDEVSNYAAAGWVAAQAPAVGEMAATQDAAPAESAAAPAMSIGEIRDALTAKGITFDQAAKKAELKKLLDEAA